MAVRTTVQIDDVLMERGRQLVPPRGFNQFVNEALAARADAIERARIERDMIEGTLLPARTAKPSTVTGRSWTAKAGPRDAASMNAVFPHRGEL